MGLYRRTKEEAVTSQQDQDRAWLRQDGLVRRLTEERDALREENARLREEIVEVTEMRWENIEMGAANLRLRRALEICRAANPQPDLSYEKYRIAFQVIEETAIEALKECERQKAAPRNP